jgi:hypothetical protein
MEQSLRVPKHVHIAPLGYEFDRIVTPLLEYEPDCAILLDYFPKDGGSEDVIRPSYHDGVRKEIRAAGIEVIDLSCDIFDLYSSLGMIAELAAVFNENDNVYVNLASGSKVTAIGGMIACMTTGAIPYYVRADSYAGGVDEPVAAEVVGVDRLPKYPVTPPERQHIAVLEYIIENEPVTKRDLIDFGAANDLPFITHYDDDAVQNPRRGQYRRLGTQIIDPLLEHKYIEVEEHSKYRYVSVTERGRQTRQAFRYLWHDDEMPPIDESDCAA